MIGVRRAILVLTLTLILGACDGIATGERVAMIPISANTDGSFGPLNISLSPDMSPVALNIKAEHGDDPAELNKWNSYHATLSRHGMVIADGVFNINQTGTPDAPKGAIMMTETMLRVNPPEAGEYELRVAPSKPVDVSLSRVEIEVRKNVRSENGNGQKTNAAF